MHFHDVGRKLSNWGRWGTDDRIGTLNHLTPARVAAAAQLVREGRIVNLGLPIGANGIQIGLGGRINPVHLMSLTSLDLRGRPDRMMVADDFLFMPLQSVTQWDGLGHVGYDDALYNGVPTSSISTASGSSELSIDQIARAGVAGRGVLLDIAGLRGVDRLAAGDGILPAELEAAEARQGCAVGPGDVVLIRTGWLRTFTSDGNAAGYWNGEPGLDVACAEWLQGREVAAVASDNWGVEVMAANDTAYRMPLHCVLIRDMGMTLGELFVLDELAEVCAARGRWDFFFTAAPLLVIGGVGTPITPLAIF